MKTPTYTIPCHACKGEGYIQLADYINEIGFMQTPDPIECPDCHGEGEIVIKMTKKEFKERCSFHRYTGYGTPAINAIFFDWFSGNGFKYGVYGSTEDLKKSELFDIMYKWVFAGEQPPWYVTYKYAETDDKRFKVPISLRGF